MAVLWHCHQPVLMSGALGVVPFTMFNGTLICMFMTIIKYYEKLQEGYYCGSLKTLDFPHTNRFHGKSILP